ncbi:Protein UmuC [compost metagenome]
MGEPYFKIRHTLRRHGILAFSSNYALYCDMSDRVMAILEEMVPATQVYSIDKSKLDSVGTQTIKCIHGHLGAV